MNLSGIWLLGNRFLLLIHIGRRTRRRRETVLEILEFRKEAPEMVVMSGFGHNANWLRNDQGVGPAHHPGTHRGEERVLHKGPEGGSTVAGRVNPGGVTPL